MKGCFGNLCGITKKAFESLIMPTIGGRELPPDLIPGGAGRNVSQPPRSMSPYGDPYQTQSPIEMTGANPWGNLPLDDGNGSGNGGAYDGDSSSQDVRMGRQHDANPNASASRPRGGTGSKSPGRNSRVCKRCGEPLLGQFVRALGGTYHLDCFQCNVSFDQDLTVQSFFFFLLPFSFFILSINH